MEGLEKITIRTSPSELSAQAANIVTRINAVESRFQKIEEAIDHSKTYWTSDAGNAHRRVYRESKEGIEEVLEGFRETAEVLETISRRYASTEGVQSAKQTGLPMDVIA